MSQQTARRKVDTAADRLSRIYYFRALYLATNDDDDYDEEQTSEMTLALETKRIIVGVLTTISHGQFIIISRVIDVISSS